MIFRGTFGQYIYSRALRSDYRQVAESQFETSTGEMIFFKPDGNIIGHDVSEYVIGTVYISEEDSKGCA